MKHTRMIRLGTTAIAAVLALPLSTPALAQVSDPLFPESPAIEESAAVPEPVITDTAPVTVPAETEAVEAGPVAAKAPAPRAKPAATRIAAPAPQPVPKAPQQLPADEPATVAEMPQTEPLPTVEPVGIAAAAEKSDADALLPIAGAAGAGILALAGLALVRRRRREDDEEFHDPPMEMSEAEPLAAAEPIYGEVQESPSLWPVSERIPAHRDKPMSNGFDISRFGPHVQAAYRGPSPDNPSLSLRRRLKRASFMDKKLRESGETSRVSPWPVAEPMDGRSSRSAIGANWPMSVGGKFTIQPAPQS